MKCKHIGQHETHVFEHNGFTCVLYHDTQVFKINRKTGTIVLNSGGWRTVTTKRRINQAFEEFDIAASLYQHKGEWFVTINNTTIPFNDRMEFCYFKSEEKAA